MSELARPVPKDLLVQRMLRAVLLSLLLHHLLLSPLILITRLSPLPLSWPTEFFSSIMSLRTLSFVLTLGVVVTLQGIICSKSYLTPPTPTSTRFSLMCSFFSPHNLSLCAMHATIGLLLVLLYLPEGGIRKNCENTEGKCIIEETPFLLASGVFSGINYFIANSFLSIRFLKFSPIPQGKISQVTRELTRLIPSAMTSSLWSSAYFLVIYYLLGGHLRGLISTLLFLNTEDEGLDTISRLLTPRLLVHVWLLSALFTISMNLMHLLYQVYLTEWMQFDVQKIYNEVTMTLPEALSAEVPVINHLGYLDLMTLSQKQRRRREVVFSLSQPGGHPYNWNCILEKCLTVIKNFSKRVDDVCGVKVEVNPQVKPLGPSVERNYATGMRNLAAKVEAPQIAQEKPPSLPGGLLETLNKRRDNFLAYVMAKPLVAYFFGVRSERKIQQVLIEGQPVVWAAEAISSLAVASLKEDSYGIVQKDLSGIIDALLGLKQALEKLQKRSLLGRKNQQDDGEMRHLLSGLRAANKRSVYRIVVGFKEYVDDLGVEGPVKDMLQGFFSFRE